MRLYADTATGQRRRSTQTVLCTLLDILNKTIAPVAPHLGEEVFQHWASQSTRSDSVFFSGWHELKDEWNNPLLADKWELIVSLRAEVNKLLENIRSQKIIGRPEEAECTIHTNVEELNNTLASLGDELSDVLLVSNTHLIGENAAHHGNSTFVQVQITNGRITGAVNIAVGLAANHKCPRCWRHRASGPTHLCYNCTSVLL